MNSKIILLCVISVLLTSLLSAAITADQWEADAALFQTLMSRTPKDYAKAVNLTRKWIQYANENEQEVLEAAGEGATKETLTAILNNIYREAADVICTDYSSIIEKDGIKAAEYAIELQKYFRANPDIFNEFAAANNSNTGAMDQVFEQAIREAILKTYNSAAKQYSDLISQGKTQEAKDLSMMWMQIVSEWNAGNSPIPNAFESFINLDTLTTVQDLKSFEADVQKWEQAVTSGDEDAALKLVEKWVNFKLDDQARASALEFIFSGKTGADWRTNLYAATYVRLWDYDVRQYEQAIIEGRAQDAIKFLDKWIEIFGGDYGSVICDELKFGFDITQALNNLKAAKADLEQLPPRREKSRKINRKVNEFIKDLERFNECQIRAGLVQTTRRIMPIARPGSLKWERAIEEALAIAEKWSDLTRNNQRLAQAIKDATGIELPQAADDSIKQLVQTMVNYSARDFNNAIANGDMNAMREKLNSWRSFRNQHNSVKVISVVAWENSNQAIESLTQMMERLIEAIDTFAKQFFGNSSSDEEDSTNIQPSGQRTLGVTAQ